MNVKRIVTQARNRWILTQNFLQASAAQERLRRAETEAVSKPASTEEDPANSTAAAPGQALAQIITRAGQLGQIARAVQELCGVTSALQLVLRNSVQNSPPNRDAQNSSSAPDVP